MTAVPSIHPLQAGDKAPAFSLPDQNGSRVALSDMKGKRFALYFYPNDDTETCTKEACNLRDHYPALKKAGFEVIGISHAPVESKKKFADKYHLPFTLLSDEGYKVAKKFGVYGDKLFMGKIITTIHRITFIIDGKGNIERVIDKVQSGKAAGQILQN